MWYCGHPRRKRRGGFISILTVSAWTSRWFPLNFGFHFDRRAIGCETVDYGFRWWKRNKTGNREYLSSGLYWQSCLGLGRVLVRLWRETNVSVVRFKIPHLYYRNHVGMTRWARIRLGKCWHRSCPKYTLSAHQNKQAKPSIKHTIWETEFLFHVVAFVFYLVTLWAWILFFSAFGAHRRDQGLKCNLG